MPTGHSESDSGAVAQWYRSLSGVTSAVGALISDSNGRVLLAEPTYKLEWVFVGGTVDAGESPLAALRRELTEELRLADSDMPVPGELLITDWIPPQPGWDRPMHHLVFDAGQVDDGWLAKLDPPEAELRRFAFVTVYEAYGLMARHEARRLEQAVLAKRSGRHSYLEAGRLLARRPVAEDRLEVD